MSERSETEDDLILSQVTKFDEEQWLALKDHILDEKFPFIGEYRMKVQGFCKICCMSIAEKYKEYMSSERISPFDPPNVIYELRYLDELMPCDEDIFNSWCRDLKFSYDVAKDRMTVRCLIE